MAMDHRSEGSQTKFPPTVSISVKITAIYFAVGILWILFSDAALGLVVRDPSVMTKLSIAKGCCYVSLTALMLYVLVRRGIAEIECSEKETRLTSAKYRELVESANSIIMRRDMAGRITFFNEFAQGFFGFSKDDILGKHVVGTITPEVDGSGRDMKKMIEDIGKHPERYKNHENENIRSNGERVWIAWTNKPIRDENGRIEEVLCIGNDITEHKRAEESIALLSFALNNVSEQAFLIDENARFHFVNEESCRVLGYTRPELLGMGVPDVDPDFPVELWPAHWNDLKALGSMSFEGRHLTKDGRIFQVEINANYFEYEGRAYDLALVHDITERKRAEEALREERQRLFDVLETLPIMICLLKPDYRVAFVNRSFRDKYGEAIGRLCYECRFGTTEPCGFCETTKVFETGLSHHWEFTGPDGSVIDAYDFPFTDVDGSPMILEMHIDITERRRAERALIEIKENLEQRVAERTAELTASDELLKQSQEIAHLGSWELDLVNNHLSWSDEVYRIFGLKPQEFDATYEAFLEAVHPDDRVAVDSAYSGSVRQGKDTYEIEHRVIRKLDGEVRIVHEKCNHFRDESGRIIRSVGMVHDITERKRAEEKLLRAKQEWERTFDSVPDLIAILDTQHRVLRANREMARRLGVTPEECTGLHCYELVHGKNHPPVSCPHSQTLNDGLEHVVEVFEERLGGDFLVTTTPLLDEKGVMIGTVHVARDITRRKRMENELRKSRDELELRVEERTAELRRSEAYLAEAQTLTHTGSWVRSKTGDIVYLSEELFRIFGFDPQEGIPSRETMSRRVHPDDLDRARANIEKSIREKVDIFDEYRILLPGGTIKHIQVIRRPVLNDAGDVVQLVGTAMDITDRKRAEEALRQSEAYLAESQRLTHTGSWGFDLASGKYIYSSEESSRIYGFDLLERPPSEEAVFQRIHPEDRDRWKANREKSLREKVDTFDEYRIVLPDGTVKDIHAIRHPVLNSAGDVVQLIGTSIDITERKRAEEALRQSEAYLAEAQRLTHTGSWGFDPVSRKYIYSSAERSRIYGFDPQEDPSSEEAVLRRIHPEDRDRWKANREKSLREKVDTFDEYRIVLPDGTVKHLHSIRHPVLNEAGNVVKLVGTSVDITERKLAEDALRRSEAYLAETQRLSHTGTWAWDLASDTFIYSSEENTRMYGFDPQEPLPTEKVLQRVHPEDRDIVKNNREKSIREKVDTSDQFRIVLPDGTVKHMHTIRRPVLNDAGDVVRLVGTSNDITERKRAEESLRASEHKYRELVENANSIILRWNSRGDITFLNEFGQKFFGYQEDEILGRNVVGTITPEIESTGRDLRPLMAKIYENPTVFEQNINENMLRDGSRVWIAWTNKAAFDAEGKLTEVLSIGSDISERKCAEEALRRSEAYLAEAQRLSHTGSWALDVASGEYDYLSEELFRIFGFDPQEGPATWEAALERVHPEDLDRVKECIEKSIREKVDTFEEYRIVLPDGTVKHLYAVRHPVLNEAGDLVKMVGTTMDITERKLAEEALQNLLADLESRVEERTKELSEVNQSLQAANKELDSFTYSVSHDLRAPLRAIDGFSMMVLKGYADKLDDEGRRKLNVIRSNTQQMGRLIDDLLTFSRLGRKEMANASLDMEAIVRSAWRELTLLNPERRIELTVQRLPHGMGDQTLIKEVVVNLLSNAIKFTKHRENAIVEVGAYPEKETDVYFVKDNGAGFDMQYYDKLFGVFQRLHSVDEFEGTGVGLAIVERIIGRHGGRVWAEGKEGEGAMFYFTLPRRGDR